MRRFCSARRSRSSISQELVARGRRFGGAHRREGAVGALSGSVAVVKDRAQGDSLESQGCRHGNMQSRGGRVAGSARLDKSASARNFPFMASNPKHAPPYPVQCTVQCIALSHAIRLYVRTSKFQPLRPKFSLLCGRAVAVSITSQFSSSLSLAAHSFSLHTRSKRTQTHDGFMARRFPICHPPCRPCGASPSRHT